MKIDDARDLFNWDKSQTWPAYVNDLYDDGYTIVKQKGFDDIQDRQPTVPDCPHCNCSNLILNDNGTYLCQACKRRGGWTRRGARIILK